MQIIYYIIILLYTVTLMYITAYCLLQFQLLYFYNRYHKKNSADRPSLDPANLPFVTIQLPIYNEQYVVERLIDNICALDYPKDRFEVQVLDDSTDETVALVQAKVEHYKSKGFQIEQITRTNRKGFKAGALKEATVKAKGDFIAIFDADFLPRPSFLRRTLPYFKHPDVGVVQTRWEHINKNYSLLTTLQALQLNVHFTVEQLGRLAGNHMLQFNGTAGIWRRQTIDEAGGWSDDTLTEDLDLSIRAQLKGWKIRYLEEVGSPAELPAEMSSFKSQQYRWMKGGAETAKKMLPTVWRSSIPLSSKIHTTFHLLGSTLFIFVFMLGILSVPMLFALRQVQVNSGVFSIFIIGTLSIIAIYYVANVSNQYTNPDRKIVRDVIKFVFLFPVFLAMSMGLSLHNSIAVLQGYIGKKTAFVRTPKFDIRSLKDTFKKGQYRTGKLELTTILEGLLCLYFIFAIVLGFHLGDRSMIFFHAMLALGYGGIFIYSIKHLKIG